MRVLIVCVLFTSLGLCISYDLSLGIHEPTELEKLPPLTTTGENTFGYLVNGDAEVITNSLEMVAIYQGGGVQFGGGGIYMVVLDPFTMRIPYEFKGVGVGTSRARYKNKGQDGEFCFYEYDNTYEGYVFFSNINKSDFIISGTFEFSTVTEDCDTVKITDGRFDMQYTP